MTLQLFLTYHPLSKVILTKIIWYLINIVVFRILWVWEVDCSLWGGWSDCHGDCPLWQDGPRTLCQYWSGVRSKDGDLSELRLPWVEEFHKYIMVSLLVEIASWYWFEPELLRKYWYPHIACKSKYTQLFVWEGYWLEGYLEFGIAPLITFVYRSRSIAATLYP